MSATPDPKNNKRLEELELAEACIENDPEAWAKVRSEYGGYIIRTLIAKGAEPDEAEDLVADVWADCLVRPSDGKSLLRKFGGRCSLRSWLVTVATNRFLDHRRSAGYRLRQNGESADLTLQNAQEAEDSPEMEDPTFSVRSLISDVLSSQLRSIPFEIRLMIRLSFLEDLTQREVARMFGLTDSKISRLLKKTFSDIHENTLREIQRKDPYLELSWTDFLELASAVADDLE